MPVSVDNSSNLNLQLVPGNNSNKQDGTFPQGIHDLVEGLRQAKQNKAKIWQLCYNSAVKCSCQSPETMRAKKKGS